MFSEQVISQPPSGKEKTTSTAQSRVKSMKTLRKRWLLLGGVFGAGVGEVVVSALAICAGAGIAAGQAKPVNASPPTITGTPQGGKTLTGNRGTWDNTPTDY